MHPLLFLPCGDGKRDSAEPGSTFFDRIEQHPWTGPGIQGQRSKERDMGVPLHKITDTERTCDGKNRLFDPLFCSRKTDLNKIGVVHDFPGDIR